VDRLLFPVKLGPEPSNVPQEFLNQGLGETPGERRARPAGSRRRPAWLFAGLLLSACGYTPVYGPSGARYEVQAGPYSTAQFEAVGEAVNGLRTELGAAGALGAGRRVVVEILRVDERSIGVQVTGAAPLARGSEVVVVGRARVYESSENSAPTRDTGDMSRAAEYAAGVSAAQDAVARSKAVREAARTLGRAMARVVLGLPEPAEG